MTKMKFEHLRRHNVKMFFCLAFFATSLTACIKMNSYQYLNISFRDSKIDPYFLENYIDGVRNKNLVVPDSIKYIFLQGDSLGQDDRLVYFKGKPKEWYEINFAMSPCWIMRIYNPEFADSSINQRVVLGDKEIERIETRFRRGKFYSRQSSMVKSTIYRIRYYII